MKIGYVGDSTLHPFHSARRFRLASYTPEKFFETARLNLEGLKQNVEYAAANNLLFYRIRSDLIPFASHEVCKENWQQELKPQFAKIATLIKKTGTRISMHPDQFVVINSPSEKIVQNSIRELQYHADIFTALSLGKEHKMQIHVGGLYGDKEAAIKRFIKTYHILSEDIKNHLVIENDDKLFTLNDCLEINRETGISLLFDNFHFTLKNDGEDMRSAIEKAFQTWKKVDGIPMVDYSSQAEGWRSGRHSDSIDLTQFNEFLTTAEGLDFDIMLEIKDKDKSALRAITTVQNSS